MTREEAIAVLKGYIENPLVDDTRAFDVATKALEQEPKTGHWILSGGYWRCSECKEKALLRLDKACGGCKEYMPVKSDYCPNCGADMRESEG